MLRSGARSDDGASTSSTTSSTTSQEQHNTMDAAKLDRLYATLNEYLLLENKYQPKLCLPAQSENGEVTIGARDGAAHVLRCLKVWFDLPTDVLIDAINIFDRFLTKMKVRPCHVPCITVSSMNIAIDMHHNRLNTQRTLTVEELVSVSQSACTSGDVCRMSLVVRDKLGVDSHTDPLTSLRWMRLFRDLLDAAAKHYAVMLDLPESSLVNLVEIAVCDAVCATARLSELALVIIYYQLEQQMVLWSKSGSVPENAYCLFDFGAQLQAHCGMCSNSLMSVGSRVREVFDRYDAQRASTHRQRLVWKLSSRTLKILRPTDRLTSLLPTIEEQHFAAETSPVRNRSGSESSESEDTSDWPRSPVLPVLCDN